MLETILAMLAPTYVEQDTRWEITAVRNYVQEQYSPRQWKCIDELWQRESSWASSREPWLAENAHSGAYGIVQALPSRKMRSHGSDYKTNPFTQVNWGMDYVEERYGSPCDALAFHDRKGWY